MKKEFQTICPLDCPDACSLLLTVEEGRVKSLRGDPHHPVAQGLICGKMRTYTDTIYAPDRILHPMRRIGPKGRSGNGGPRFARISWEEALDEVAGRMREAAARWGPESILPMSYSGTMGVVNRNAGQRFFHRLGASLLERTICTSTVKAGWNMTMGKDVGVDCAEMAKSDYIVLWGTNAVSTNLHILPFIRKARAAGAKLTVIDVYRNRTAKLADEYVAVRPGTDGALALGMMHVLVREGLIDRAYIEAHTLGFEALRGRLEDYPPGRVEAVTGVAAEAVARLAREYGRARAPFIRMGVGLSRHSNGGMNARTVACLPGLTGALERPGGGIFCISSGAFGLNMAAFERPEWSPEGTRTINIAQAGRALTEAADPPVKVFYVYHSAAAATLPDAGAVRRGLLREDLFTVVHEIVPTDTVDYADIVLPAPTFAESPDIFTSYGQYMVGLNEGAIPPEGEAKANIEVFSLLAERLGFEEPDFREGVWEAAEKLLDSPRLAEAGITLARLREKRYMRAPVSPENPFAEGFGTPSGRLEFFSARMAEMGLDPLPCHVPLEEGPESGELAGRFPLQLVVPPGHHFLNSTGNGAARNVRGEGEQRVLLHPAEARARGLADGGWVRVRSPRGEIRRRLGVTEDVPEGVAIVEGVHLARTSPDGKSINELTSQRLTDMGRGPCFHTNLVEVEAFAGAEAAPASLPAASPALS
ncbi:MAG: molybdopterin oxidoreductase family protein, partial [bacterium]